MFGMKPTFYCINFQYIFILKPPNLVILEYFSNSSESVCLKENYDMSVMFGNMILKELKQAIILDT